MKRTILLLAATLLLTAAGAQTRPPHPLYIVNGTPMEDISAIPPGNIEQIETLPADEESIARYGDQAAHGVILVTLRYDEPARFEAPEAEGLSFGEYIAGCVKWENDEPAARVIVRYTVTAEGKIVVGDVLESTDNRLRRRVLKAVEAAPAWQPARKLGTPVATEGVLRIQLPAGKPMPQLPQLVWR